MCVHASHLGPEGGYPIRDPDSTTYTGAARNARKNLASASIEKRGKRGWSRAQKKVVIGDGAEWIWNLVAEHFPDAIQIVDLYHARQHLWEVARQLYPHEEVKQQAWMKVHQKRLLDKGKNSQCWSAHYAPAISIIPKLSKRFVARRTILRRKRQRRMQYPKFRRQHLFIGSGVIEAGCKTVIASRLKRSGVFWTVPGANAIRTLRCSHLNGRFEDYWEQRRAA